MVGYLAVNSEELTHVAAILDQLASQWTLFHARRGAQSDCYHFCIPRESLSDARSTAGGRMFWNFFWFSLGNCMSGPAMK